MKTISFYKSLALLGLSAFVWVACKPAEPTPTPVDVDAIRTSVVMTVLAEQTATALALPTSTFTATPTDTPLPPPTLPPATTAAPFVSSLPDNSTWIRDVTIKDGTILNPGETVTKTWLVSNSGTTTWTPTYKVIYGYGDPMGGVATPIGKTVKPGEQVEVSIVITVPTSKSGRITGAWRLANDRGEPFGTWLTIDIQVAGSAATLAPTDTPEPTETPTP